MPFWTVERFDAGWDENCVPAGRNMEEEVNTRLIKDLIRSAQGELELLDLAVGREQTELAESHVGHAVRAIREIEYEIWHSNRVSGVPYRTK